MFKKIKKVNKFYPDPPDTAVTDEKALNEYSDSKRSLFVCIQKINFYSPMIFFMLFFFHVW